MEYKLVMGFIVKKEGHPIHRNSDGYAKRCYAIYKNEEQMKNGKPIAYEYTMDGVRRCIKWYTEVK